MTKCPVPKTRYPHFCFARISHGSIRAIVLWVCHWQVRMLKRIGFPV